MNAAKAAVALTEFRHAIESNDAEKVEFLLSSRPAAVDINTALPQKHHPLIGHQDKAVRGRTSIVAAVRDHHMSRFEDAFRVGETACHLAAHLELPDVLAPPRP